MFCSRAPTAGAPAESEPEAACRVAASRTDRSCEANSFAASISVAYAERVAAAVTSVSILRDAFATTGGEAAKWPQCTHSDARCQARLAVCVRQQ
eukprot:6345744-Prymnesium_polylepis.1